jgi:hypothetical protein
MAELARKECRPRSADRGLQMTLRDDFAVSATHRSTQLGSGSRDAEQRAVCTLRRFCIGGDRARRVLWHGPGPTIAARTGPGPVLRSADSRRRLRVVVADAIAVRTASIAGGVVAGWRVEFPEHEYAVRCCTRTLPVPTDVAMMSPT